MEYQKYTIILRELAEKITTLCKNAPQIGKARGISMRFKRGVSESGYFHFIDNPEIDLTNNATLSEILFNPKVHINRNKNRRLQANYFGLNLTQIFQLRRLEPTLDNHG